MLDYNSVFVTFRCKMEEGGLRDTNGILDGNADHDMMAPPEYYPPTSIPQLHPTVSRGGYQPTNMK